MKRSITLTSDLKLSSEKLGNDSWLLTPKGTMDSSTTEEFNEKLTALFGKENTIPHVLMDMSSVKYISSVGLGTLIGLLKKTKQHGSSFGLYNPPLAVQRVLEISKLDFLMVKPENLESFKPFADFVLRKESERAVKP